MDYYYFKEEIPQLQGMKHFIDLSNRYDEFISNYSCFKRKNFVFEKEYNTASIIRPIYDWILEYIGPSTDMIWDIDRLFFDDNPPNMPSTSFEWDKSTKFVFDNPSKWLLCDFISAISHRNKLFTGVAFTTEESAMLFKLTWG